MKIQERLFSDMQGLKHLPEKAFGECDFLKKERKPRKGKCGSIKMGFSRTEIGDKVPEVVEDGKDAGDAG